MKHNDMKIFDNAVSKLTAFAKSKAALPVLLASVAVITIGIVAVVLTSGSDDSQVQGDSSKGDTSSSYSTTVKDEEYNAESAKIDTSKFEGTVLPQTEKASQDYIDNTLFLGDSNTVRYMQYGHTTLDNTIAVIGMGAGAIPSLECAVFKGTNDKTMVEGVAIIQPQRVVFGFGTNNLTGDRDYFIETYEKGIKAAYKAYPYFDIIVNAIPPVDKNRAYNNISMQDIDEFNEALVEMCEENDWKFLNSSEALKDKKTGFAQYSYTIDDGLHLSQDGAKAVFEYFATHAYETEDVRPKPLKKVPERGETPPNLIIKDPIKDPNANTKIPVTFTASEGGYIEGTTEQSVTKGKTTSEVTAKAEEGYVFAGWESATEGVSDINSETITYTAPDSDALFGGVVVTAKFEPINYTVTFSVKTLNADETVAENAGAKFNNESITIMHGDSVDETLKLLNSETQKYVLDIKESTIDGVTITDNKDGTYTFSIPAVTKALNVVAIIKTVELEPTPSPSVSPSPSPTPSPTTAPTAEPTQTPSTEITPSPEQTQTPSPTPSKEPTNTPTPAATPSPEATPVATVEPKPEPPVEPEVTTPDTTVDTPPQTQTE